MIVDLEIARDVERIPDRGVFRAEPVKRKSASLLVAHFPQFIQERDHVEKPDRVLFVAVLKIKIGIVTRRAHFRGLDLRVVRAAHRLWKTDQVGFFATNRPIVSVTADRDDPLLGIRVFEQHMQPAFKPRTRPKRSRRIDIGGFVKERGHKPVDVAR